ncbi:MAG: hypothetical protein LBT85_03040 [Bifidobacteriaceae bacterium]|nr:hypothetical protein [Bifidobacteriaceae bacterium]
MGESSFLKSPIELEVEQKKHLPWGYIIIIISTLVLPYWIGRNTALLYTVIPRLNPVIYLLIGQVSAILPLLAIILLIGLKAKKITFVFFVLAFSGVQFLCGFTFLKTNFYDSTQIVFGSRANLANAISIGIIAAIIIFIIYIIFVLISYIVISRQSNLVWITQAKYNWIFFLFFQIIGFLITYNLSVVWQLIA